MLAIYASIRIFFYPSTRLWRTPSLTNCDWVPIKPNIASSLILFYLFKTNIEKISFNERDFDCDQTSEVYKQQLLSLPVANFVIYVWRPLAAKLTSTSIFFIFWCRAFLSTCWLALCTSQNNHKSCPKFITKGAECKFVQILI